MRTNIGVILLLVASVSIIGFIGWIFYLSIEFYDETEESAWSLEALRNPYLAAQQFMQQGGIDSAEADSLARLNSLDGVSTVLITDANQVVNPRQLEQVLDWLENGGNLIVTANSIGDSEDLLLEEFNVSVNWRSEDYDEQEMNTDAHDATGEETDSAKEEPSVSDSLREYNAQIDAGKTAEEIAQLSASEATLTTIDFGGDIGDLVVAFNSYRVLTHPYSDGDDADESSPQPFSWSASEYGIHMMQFDVGDGLLTIISDPTIWTSRRIGQHDHAYLLWVLSSKDGGFAILHPALRDSIWILISRNAPEFLIALAISIVFWLWHLGHRFGRIVPRDSSRGRALSEHFSATANYLWHRRTHDYLIKPVRQQIYRRASIRLPEFASAREDPERQLQLISRHCDVNVTMVDFALNSKSFNETSFMRTVKLLKYIEQSL